jgi:hypothetical protein
VANADLTSRTPLLRLLAIAAALSPSLNTEPLEHNADRRLRGDKEGST